jgi:hypothetical protein
MLRLSLSMTLVVTGSLAVGCGRTEENYRRDKTNAELLVLRDFLRCVEKTAPHDFRPNTLEELSGYLVSHHLAERKLLEELRLDAWGRPIEFSAKRVGSTLECALASNGRDGVRGGGDDVVLTFTIVVPVAASQPSDKGRASPPQ